MRRSRPLRVLIPAVLLAIGLLLTTAVTIGEIQSRQEDLELDVIQRAASLGNREVSNIEYALARGDIQSAKLQVALLVSEPDLHLALVTDADLQVIQATRGEYRDRAFGATASATSLDLLEDARSSQRAQHRLSPDGRRFEAAFPFRMPVKPGELRSSRRGALYLVFDLSDARALGRSHAIQHATWLAVSLLGLCLLAGFFLHGVVARRINLLLEAVNRLAAGDRQVRAEIGGRDELSTLAEGFNRMAATLESRDASLHQANDDLRNSEARFRQVVENINEAFRIVDAETKAFIYSSPAFEKIWGRSRETLFESPQGWLDAIHGEDRARVEQAYTTHCLTGDFDEIFRVLRPDGTQRWVRDRCFPVREESGQIVRLVGVTEDITERHELEAQYHQAQKLEAVGRLAGGIAHDFNNLLTAILGNAQLALQDFQAGQASLLSIQEILRAGERAKGLVQQILVFNRGQPQDKQVVSLVDLVQEAIKQVKASVPAGVQLDLQVAEDTPHVLGDATRLHQVVMNLLTNAGHALEGKPGTIEVRLSKIDVDAAMARHYLGLPVGPAIRFSVRDTGRGMNQETLGRIFEPFFTTKEVGQGTGLGLSLAYSIVQEHQGAIDVQSQPGKGSVFTVYLPATSLAMKAPDTKPLLPEQGHGQRILYLDDDDALVSLITRSLQRIGYEVTAFTDQQEALRHLAVDPLAVDVFVTDFNMPGMSGLDVAREALKIRAGMPVLLISGYVTDALVHTARQVGVRAVLEKPDGIAALTKGIDAALKA